MTNGGTDAPSRAVCAKEVQPDAAPLAERKLASASSRWSMPAAAVLYW